MHVTSLFLVTQIDYSIEPKLFVFVFCLSLPSTYHINVIFSYKSVNKFLLFANVSIFL